MILRPLLAGLLMAGLCAASHGIEIDMPNHYFSGETAVISGSFTGEAETQATLSLIFSINDRILSKSSTKIKPSILGRIPFELEFNVPETRRQIQGDLSVTSDAGFTISFGHRVAIFPKGAMRDMEILTKNKRIGIVDPNGTLAAHLSDRHIRFDTLPTRTSMRAFDGDLAILNAVHLGGKRDSLLDPFNAGVQRGLTVLILEPPNIPPNFRNGMELHFAPSRAVRDGDGTFFDKHPLTAGLERPPLGNWLSGWRPDGFVATSAVSTPVEGNVRVLAAPVESAETLAVMMEVPEGNGRYVFSTLRTGASAGDPVPPLVLDNMILHYLHRDTEAWRRAALVFDTGEEELRAFYASVGDYGDSNPNFGETYPLWIFDGGGAYLKSFASKDPKFWFRFFKRVARGEETGVFVNLDAGGWEIVAEYMTESESEFDPSGRADTTLVRLPHKDGEIFLVRLDGPDAHAAPARRLWLRLLTEWNIEIRPTERSKNKNFQE